jgi:hypothetical protein
MRYTRCMDDSPTPPQTSESPTSVGSFLAIVIVVILFALAGIYLLVKEEMNRTPPPGQEQANS